MQPDEFRIIIDKIKPYTAYIYLHVLGEPLLHPAIDQILDIAAKAEIQVNITTNGALLEKKKDILLSRKIRQINFSLHDAEENIRPEKLDEYMNSVLDFTEQLSGQTYVNLRLWNTDNSGSDSFNRFCVQKVGARFSLEFDPDNIPAREVKYLLKKNVFMQFAPRFDWPDGVADPGMTQKTCYALRDHIAILADGTVIPCCIDADAHLALDNIFVSELSDILSSERAIKIRDGFKRKIITEDYCRSCGFFVNR